MSPGSFSTKFVEFELRVDNVWKGFKRKAVALTGVLGGGFIAISDKLQAIDWSKVFSVRGAALTVLTLSFLTFFLGRCSKTAQEQKKND